MARRYRALAAIIGEPTSDRRIFDALTWRTPPLCLMWQRENLPQHEGAVIVGRLDAFEQDGNEIWTAISWDEGSEDGREAKRLVDEKFLKGVSIDAAVLDMLFDEENELVRYSGEIGALTLVSFPAFRDTMIEWYDDELVPAGADDTVETAAEAPADEGEPVVVTAEDAEAVEAEADPVVEEPETVAAEVTDLPAPAPAAPRVVTFDDHLGLIAAGASMTSGPPAEWFAAPDVDRRRGLHVEADGRIWGHLYGWGECHTGSPAGECIRVPRGGSYSHIVDVDGRGVLCADGSLVQTGPIFLHADHAPIGRGWNWNRAKDHYANSGLAVADVRVGEDEFGIWVAGMVRPGVPDEIVHVLRASAPSGDWRTILDYRKVGGRMELIAILQVNFAGYPALARAGTGGRVLAASLDGMDLTALVAAGAAHGTDCGCGGHGAVDDVLARLDEMAGELAALRAAEDARHADAIAAMAAEIGMDPDSMIERWAAEIEPVEV